MLKKQTVVLGGLINPIEDNMEPEICQKFSIIGNDGKSYGTWEITLVTNDGIFYQNIDYPESSRSFVLKEIFDYLILTKKWILL